IGTVENNASIVAFNDIYPDDVVATLPSEGQDNWQPWPVIGLPVSGTTGTVAGTSLKDSGTSFPAATGTANNNTGWAPGTQIRVNGIPYTIYRVVSTSIIETVENMASQTGVTWRIDEPVLMGQPLPCLWGDEQLGTMFACGDNVNPGRLYFSNGNDPDGTKETNYIDITSSSEQLMNGAVYNARGFVFSTERFFQTRPDGQGGWIAEQIPGEGGLFARWALTREPAPILAYLTKTGINITTGGSTTSLTDADLYPIFPNEGNAGTTTNNV